MNTRTKIEEKFHQLKKSRFFDKSPYPLPTFKNWLITLTALTIFALTGLLGNRFGQFIGIEKILTESMLFLKESLIISLQHFASLSVIKGLTAAISDSTVFGLAAGKIISPISSSVDWIWKLFGVSICSITCQMAILNFSTIVSKYIFIAGTLSLMFNFVDVFRRIGICLMLVGVIFYVAMPCSIYAGKLMFEKNSQVVNRMLSKDLEQFKNQVDDVNVFSLSLFSKPRKTLNDIVLSLSQKLDELIHSFIRYFSNLLIMFVITPLFFYSIVYLLIKRVLCIIGMGKTSIIVDKGVIGALKKIRV